MFSRAARRATCALKPAAFRAPVMNLTRSLARFEQEIGYTFDGNPNHHSDAEELIDLEPIVYVKGHTAICKGGGGALGHPVEYIQLHRAYNSDKPETCKYCGTRFMAEDHH